ncbi:hypothetical protein OBBRIDRAFT_281974 [Obba rivulosa]|uniref:Uncharacterized protein n=1 Tax=Obba rivulosa TaxID=1052685 RepID=A0A8E2APX1_9APHY|nr:hypothetical protein OBBRIDRAFT_281974 [Obba rivulosa]
MFESPGVRSESLVSVRSVRSCMCSCLVALVISVCKSHLPHLWQLRYEARTRGSYIYGDRLASYLPIFCLVTFAVPRTILRHRAPKCRRPTRTSLPKFLPSCRVHVQHIAVSL